MAKPFDGCVIALAGKFEQTHGELTKQIKANGGKHSTKVTDVLTHLVADKSRLVAKDPKMMQAAQFPLIKIVDIQWLVDSIRSQQKQSEAVHGIRPPNGGSPGPRTAASSTASKQPPIARPTTTVVNEKRATSPAKAANPPTAGKGKKRARNKDVPIYVDLSADDLEEDVEQSSPKKHKDGQKAKSTSLRVPVDENCPLLGTYRVYIDEDGIIYDASLNQTSAGDNHNKYYRIQLLVLAYGNYKTWTRWGRVGAAGASAVLGDGSLDNAIFHFQKKFRDKSGNSWENRLEPARTDGKKPFYTFIERQYENESSNDDEAAGSGRKERTRSTKSAHVESQLSKQLQELMELIFNKQYFEDTMKVLDYDAEKLPLGQLSKRTLEQGFKALKDVGQLLANPRIGDFPWTHSLEKCSNMFYTLIPHNFGRQRPPIIRTEEALRKEICLMESLSDLEIANTIMEDRSNGGIEGESVHPLDRQFAALHLDEMVPLSHSSGEFRGIKDYLIHSRGSTHNLQFKVQDIFRVQRKGEADFFENVAKSYQHGVASGHTFLGQGTGKSGHPDAADRRLLWHGSRCTNFGGILSQGLRIAPAEAPVSGYAFGKGVYFADASTKSANYCHSYTSGGTGLLLLCEVLLKKVNELPMLELEHGDCNAEALAKRNGSIATWGKGQTGPRSWKDAGGRAGLGNQDIAGVMMPDVAYPPGPTGANGYLQYNEYIVYDVAQVKLRYLLRVEMN